MQLKKYILNIYFLFRLPLVFFLKLLFKPSTGKPEKISRILVVRIDRIGDFIITLPLIDNLRLEYPLAVIDIIVRPYLKSLALLVKNIDNVIIYDKKISFYVKLRKGNYDLAIDALYDYKLNSAFLAFITGAPLRAGFTGGFRELLFNYPVTPSKDKDMAQLNLELLKKLGIPVKISAPRLEIENKNISGDACICIHPGGYYEAQRWAPDKFILLGKKLLAEYKIKLLIAGGQDDKELVNYLISGIGDKNAKGSITDLKDLVFILSGSKLLICNNSGPLHLAAALNIPTVSTMGPTDPVLWRPNGDNNIVIRKELECSPCGRAECKEHKCMDLISVDEVFTASKNLMGKVYGIEKYKKDPDN